MSTVVQDTFTDTDGTALASHTATSGATWVKTGTVSAIINANSLHFLGTASGDSSRWSASAQASTTEHDVEADITMLSNVGKAGVLGRGGSTSSVTSYYLAWFNTVLGQWELLRQGGTGGNASLGTYADPGFTVGVTRHVRLEIRNSTKRLYVDNVLRIEVTDDSLTTGKFVGIRMDRQGSATTGLQIDNFLASTPPTTPTNIDLPAITGTAVVGQVVTSSTGSWSQSPTSYAYQWKRNGSNISGATSSTYTLVTADLAQSVTCTVTATNSAGSAAATSAAIIPADTLPAPTNTVAPLVTTVGYPTTGHVATLVSNGTWDDTPTSYTRQWKRNGVDIAGATGTTYTLASADEGHSITCAVTATNSTGSGTAASNGIPATANHVDGTQTDVIYQGTATGLVGSVYCEIVKVSDGTVAAARDSASIAELVAGSGIYRARRLLDSGQYVAIFDEGGSTLTVAPVVV